MSSLKTIRQGEFFLTCRRVRFLFHSCFQLIVWGPPTSDSTIYFTQSADLNVNLNQKHPHKDTWNNVWPKVSTSRGPVRLTCTIIHHTNQHYWASLMVQMAKNLSELQETRVRSLGQKDSPGEGNGNPLQDSCLGSSMNTGAWQAAVHGVTKSRTWLSV